MILQRQNKKLYQSLLGLALGASLLISGASSAIAQSWPDHQSGSNDGEKTNG